MPMTPEQLRESLVRRFLAGREERGPDECWPWLRATRNGYGVLRMGKTEKVYAHSLALELAVGVEGGRHACHRCDNKLCCNPAHLFWGTDAAFEAGKKARRMKDVCQKGHPMTPENTYVRLDKHGYEERHCLPCRREQRGVREPRPGRMTETHCRNGHELAVVGIYVDEARNRRRCRACVSASNARTVRSR